MRWWDAIRSVVNTKIHVTIENTVANLLANAEQKDHPPEKIILNLGFLRIKHFMQESKVEGAAMTVNLESTNEDDTRLPPLIEIPIINVCAKLFWKAESEDQPSQGLSITSSINLKSTPTLESNDEKR